MWLKSIKKQQLSKIAQVSIIILSFVIGGRLLASPMVYRLFEINESSGFRGGIVFLLSSSIILLAWWEAKNGNFIKILVRKSLYWLGASFLAWTVALLTLKNFIPQVLGVFIALFIGILFCTLILFFLKDLAFESRIEKVAPFIVGAMILVFVVFYTYLCFLRFEAGLSNLYDLGNMEQAVWGTLHGYFLRSTTGALATRLEGHTDLFLVLLVPFYALWPSPKLLLLAQVVIAGLGALPLYLISKKLLKSTSAGLVFALAYLINPLLGASLLFDFHALTLVSSFLLFAFYFLLEKRYIFYFIFILLALSCKEEISLLILALGIYVYFKHNRKVGIATSLMGALWFMLAFGIIIPHFSSNHENKFLVERYSYHGGSQKDILKSFLTRPGLTLINLLDYHKLVYFLYLILPWGALVIFSPFILLALPSFLIYVFSNFWPMYSGGYQYSSVMVFYLAIGTILGIRFWLKRFPHERSLLFGLLLYLFLASMFFGFRYRLRIWGPQRPRFDIKAALEERANKKSEIDRIKTLIPSDVPLSASGAVGVFFAGRKDIYLFPKINNARYIVLDRPSPLNARNSYADYLRDLNNQLLRNKDFQIIFKGNYYLVAKAKKY